MKLREFSEEDITLHALSNGGRSVRVMAVEIDADYATLVKEYSILPNHKTFKSSMRSKVGDLISRIVDMHDICRNSEDDPETRKIAKKMKTMNVKLNKMLDLIQ